MVTGKSGGFGEVERRPADRLRESDGPTFKEPVEDPLNAYRLPTRNDLTFKGPGAVKEWPKSNESILVTTGLENARVQDGGGPSDKLAEAQQASHAAFEKATKAMNAGNVAEALKHYQEAIKPLETELALLKDNDKKEEGMEFVRPHFRLAKCLRETSNHKGSEQADQLLEKAINRLEKEPGKFMDKAQVLLEKSFNQLELGTAASHPKERTKWYVNAEKDMERSLNHLEKGGLKDHRSYFGTLNTLSKLELSLGQYDKSETHAKEQIDWIKRNFLKGEQEKALADPQLTYALSLSRQGKDASQAFEEAFRLAEKFPGTFNEHRRAEILRELGFNHLTGPKSRNSDPQVQSEAFTKAKEALTGALRLVEKSNESEDKDLRALLLTDRATAELALKQYEAVKNDCKAAIPLLKASPLIKEDGSGPMGSILAQTMSRYIEALKGTGNKDDALEAVRQQKELTQILKSNPELDRNAREIVASKKFQEIVDNAAEHSPTLKALRTEKAPWPMKDLKVVPGHNASYDPMQSQINIGERIDKELVPQKYAYAAESAHQNLFKLYSSDTPVSKEEYKAAALDNIVRPFVRELQVSLELKVNEPVEFSYIDKDGRVRADGQDLREFVVKNKEGKFDFEETRKKVQLYVQDQILPKTNYSAGWDSAYKEYRKPGDVSDQTTYAFRRHFYKSNNFLKPGW